MLDVLRTELGLPVDETTRLEREAFTGGPASPSLQDARTPRSRRPPPEG